MKYDITPVPAPRQVQSDKWKKRPCVMRYRAFRDEVKLKIKSIPDYPHITFTMPMPKSWSDKRKSQMFGRPHNQKPDLDNLIKSLLDSLFDDDSHIWDIRATKVWGYTGEIEITEIK